MRLAHCSLKFWPGRLRFLPRESKFVAAEYMVRVVLVEPHRDELLQNLQGEDHARARRSIDWLAQSRHDRFHLAILLVFITQAAKQSTTHAGNFAWIDRQILSLCHVHRNFGIDRQPRATAECASASAKPTQESCLVARPYLLELDTALERR